MVEDDDWDQRKPLFVSIFSKFFQFLHGGKGILFIYLFILCKITVR